MNLTPKANDFQARILFGTQPSATLVLAFLLGNLTDKLGWLLIIGV